MQKNIQFALALCVLALSVSIAGCEEKEAEPASAKTDQTDSTTAKKPQPADSGFVAVAKTGTKFDPPVKPDAIPNDAWMCDMGTVHFASLEKGDGKCPTCGMGLKHKMAGGHEGHEGHEGHHE